MLERTNSIPLFCEKRAGVFEYEVKFEQQVDSMKFRGNYVYQQMAILGPVHAFNGVILYLPKRLPDKITHLVSKNIADDSDVNLQIIFKKSKRLGDKDCVQLYNILFDRIFKVLNYLRVDQNFYDPTEPQMLTNEKLEVWPGYVKAVEELEGGLMLTLDVSHRVLATRSVREQMVECQQNNPAGFKDNIKRDLIGKSVLIPKINKSYRIDDMDFTKTPSSTFTIGDVEMSFAEYYKRQYKILISDMKQPMLVSRKEVRIYGELEKREYLFFLIPEQCVLTGLPDPKNLTVQKELATCTKLTPFQHVRAYKLLLKDVENTPVAKKVLSDWGLSLDKEPINLKARLLDEVRIYFGRGKDFTAGEKADFSHHAATNEVLDPIHFHTWLLVYVKTDKMTATMLEEAMLQYSAPTGIRIARPRCVEVLNDLPGTFVTEIRKALVDTKIQIVVIIFPSLRDDRYEAVKKLLCSEIPVPSQVVQRVTLKNPDKIRSIVMNIILQMNCKLGGSLWEVKIPLKDTMICGIDTYQEGTKGVTVAGFVATYDMAFTKWYSKATIQEKGEELVNGIIFSMCDAITKYKSHNQSLPERIVVYRDGVGKGHLDVVRSYEVTQCKEAFKRIDPDYKPKLTFIVVEKQINLKFFKHCDIPEKVLKQNLVNALPGSVLDNTVTSRYLYDFYIISQYVREGSATPTHYIVLEDEADFQPDILQEVTYKLCFLYYNWPGSIRVPAPCQYAHKLADLVGMSIKRAVDEKLADKLYFL